MLRDGSVDFLEEILKDLIQQFFVGYSDLIVIAQGQVYQQRCYLFHILLEILFRESKKVA